MWTCNVTIIEEEGQNGLHRMQSDLTKQPMGKSSSESDPRGHFPPYRAPLRRTRAPDKVYSSSLTTLKENHFLLLQLQIATIIPLHICGTNGALFEGAES